MGRGLHHRVMPSQGWIIRTGGERVNDKHRLCMRMEGEVKGADGKGSSSQHI